MDLSFFNGINHRIKQLEAVIKLLEESTPKVNGHLRISRNGNGIKYYHVTKSGESNGKYLRKSESAKIRALAQKSYNEKMLTLAKAELDHLRNCITDYPGRKFEELYSLMSNERKELIDPVWIPDDVYKQQWLSKEYTRLPFDEKDTTQFYSNSGIRLRSKSEVIIANKLDELGVPYLVEDPLYLRGFGTVHPDFKILIVSQRIVKLWEHHGMMDSPSYVENNFLRKNNAYIANGYFPGINLIQTFESHSSPLNMNTVDAIIKQFLL